MARSAVMKVREVVQLAFAFKQPTYKLLANNWHRCLDVWLDY